MTAVACAIHKVHQPEHLTTELHHVIPVAWQTHVPGPATAPYPGSAGSRGETWDDRTMPLCPTGHRDVHHWIVRLMKEGIATGATSPQEAYDRVVKGSDRLRKEPPVALMALERFVSENANATLQDLVAIHEWGEA